MWFAKTQWNKGESCYFNEQGFNHVKEEDIIIKVNLTFSCEWVNYELSSLASYKRNLIIVQWSVGKESEKYVWVVPLKYKPIIMPSLFLCQIHSNIFSSDM